MKKTLSSLLLLAFLSLAACADQDAGEEDTLSTADQAKATELLRNYEAARSAQNWEVAETYAGQIADRYAGSEAATALAASVESVRAKAGELREARRLRDLWDYQAVAVGTGVQRSASIHSRTVPVEEGELAPAPDAQLVLRDHPAWGLSSYLLLAQKRFKCGSPCAVQIQFDDAPAQRYAGKQADSGQGPALFIEDEKRFIAAMDAAKRVRIALPKGSGTIPALVFEVGGYDAARFAKP